jgi:hypothetical protein
MSKTTPAASARAISLALEIVGQRRRARWSRDRAVFSRDEY